MGKLAAKILPRQQKQTTMVVPDGGASLKEEIKNFQDEGWFVVSHTREEKGWSVVFGRSILRRLFSNS